MSTWTDARFQLLKKLWAEGLSCSQIASQLSCLPGAGITRNAVIGKVSRHRLPPRATASRKVYASARRKGKPTAQPRFNNGSGNPAFRALFEAPIGEAGLRPDGYIPPPEEIVIPVAERKSLDDLELRDCRWPIGDPQHPFPEFHFCARPKVPGLSYCECHARRAFQPPQALRRNSSLRMEREQRPATDSKILEEVSDA